ncbi:MAG: phage tail tip lysozyme [Turicibacter sp.]|nr:phage tail tip lysozyme [Turicibacter sp.]
MTREEIEQYTWNYLKNKGLADEVVSEIMGNIEGESSFNPDLVEVGSQVGFGLCQWSYERRTQLENYGTDLDHQLNFLWAELTGGDSSIGADNQWINAKGYKYDMFINNQYSIDEGTKAFCWCWERPLESSAHIDRRIKSAYAYYEKFKGTGGGGGGGDTPIISDNYIGKLFTCNNHHYYMKEDSLFGQRFSCTSKIFFCYNRLGSKATIEEAFLELQEEEIPIYEEDEETGEKVQVDTEIVEYYIVSVKKRKLNVNKNHLRHYETDIEIRNLTEIETAHGRGGSTSDKVENAVQWMIDIANDDTHGYDQNNRWGADYDCSSLVISGFEQAGIPLKTNGATYTGDLKEVALSCGFEEISISDWNDTSQFERGDIILNERHHVCCYIGNSQIVQASINEIGGVTGGQTGDQTGNEILVKDYYVYHYGWDCVLRYTE